MKSASLIEELKRRRVFRAIIGYGVLAFAALQIIEPIMHGLHWPDSVLTYLVVALAVGFPVVVGLAWIFDVNDGRIERTEPAPGLRGARLVMVLVGVGVLAAAPGVVWYFVIRKPAPASAAAAATPSIAVLPFVNLSSDKEQEYLSDGIAEEINLKLSRLKGLSVAARTSVARFKGATVNPSEIGTALGVAWLLEGSVRRAGDRIRVTTTLLKAADGLGVWSEDAEAKLDDIFAMEERIAARTVDALALKLTPDERRSLSDWGTRNAKAYDEYLQGQAIYESSARREQFDAALSHFERALLIDARFAPALAGLASVEAQYYRDFDSDPARLSRAEELARRALEIDPHLGRASLALGEVYVARFDYGAAAAQFARLTEDEPRSYLAWDYLGWAEGYQTPPRAAEAEQAIRRSIELNPDFTSADRSTALNLAWSAMARAQLGELDKAFAALEKAMASGYRDAGELRASNWFAPLRSDPRLRH